MLPFCPVTGSGPGSTRTFAGSLSSVWLLFDAGHAAVLVQVPPFGTPAATQAR